MVHARWQIGDLYVGLNLCSSNDSARQPSSSVAGGRAELMATQPQVVDISVHDEGASDNVVGSRQGDLGVGDGHFGDTIGSGLDVSKVTCVAHSRIGTAVGFSWKGDGYIRLHSELQFAWESICWYAHLRG